MDTMQQQPEEEEKNGLIPNEQLAGSDADKAYDQDGNFPEQRPAKGTESDTSSKGMGGSDTRGEDSATDNKNQTSSPAAGPDDEQEDDDQGHVET